MKEVRADKRSARLLRGSLRCADGKSFDIIIHNLSTHGIGARLSNQVPVKGPAVQVDIPTMGKFHGTIRWQANGRIGIRVTETLDPKDIHLGKGPLNAKEKYIVASRFQPVTSTYRPGFGKR
ncbi:MAG: PilZ domain-containing protein [Sphingomonadales bacterium]|nr:MAG: PilZ domain-containing protein [Sphingomonadales bacterium]TNF04902.1 MAG: PilZ domain-containing protein [Sphingomonadales bacterium]